LNIFTSNLRTVIITGTGTGNNPIKIMAMKTELKLTTVT